MKDLIRTVELLEQKASPTHEKVFAKAFEIFKKYPDATVEKRGNTERGIYSRKGDMGLYLRVKVEKSADYNRSSTNLNVTHPLESELRKAYRGWKDGWKRMKISNETGPKTGRFHVYLIHLGM